MKYEDAAVDSRRAIEEDWNIFSSLKRVTNHWERPGWESGRRAYYWYVTFDDDTEVRSMAAKCQAALSRPSLDFISPADLHMTIDRLGAEDEFEALDIRAIGDAARDICQDFSVIAIDVGPLAGSAGAVRFSATPWAPLYELRKALRSAASTCKPKLAFDSSRFRPHVGIAYNNADAPAKSLIRSVEPLRSLPSVSVSIGQVSLVLLERKHHAWEWTVSETVPLARAEAPARAR